MTKPMPVMPKQCSTCPFRTGGWEHVRPLLVERAMNEATPICHSTGRKALVKNSKRAHICRGARDFQLQFFAGIGFIEAPTDKAWQVKCDELGIENIATGGAE